jgi:tetratricopeptide (TPR) repeat protein
MEILKKAIVILLFISSSFWAVAQNEAAMQKAFSESYKQEANAKYTDAINELAAFNNKDNYEVNLRIGWLYYLNKNYTQAQTYYHRAVTLKPYAIEAKLGYIKALAAAESWDKVMQQYNEILKIDPQNYTANYWSGVIHYNRKKYETAVKQFEKLINLYPFDYDANHLMAWTCLYLGRLNDAKTLFNKALLIKPNDASCIEGLSKIK